MHDDLPYQAYKKLYNKEPDYRLLVRYHGKFTGYNANVRKTRTSIEFALSKKLESCEPEIQIGVMQFLLNKLFKTKLKTDEIDYYHSFVKKMSDLAPVTKTDLELMQSFDRMSERYFGGLMTRPNLVWGEVNKRLLGHYTYATDTIMISAVLKEAPEDILDYVMYHEMLHKKHKFKSSGNQTRAHTKAFRDDERKFHLPDAEAQLKRYLRSRLRSGPREDRTFLQKVLDYF